MPPTLGFDPIGTVQDAIMSLLSVQMPQFLSMGNRMFISFATILIVWQGIRMMLAWRESGEHMFAFAKLLLLTSFGYAMIAFYASPIPGIGESFSSLITNEAITLARMISGQSVQNAQETLNTLWNSLEQPDAWSIIANLLYWTMLLVIAVAQFALMFVISFSMIASAVCGLVGPIFVPFFIVPTLEWLFWGGSRRSFNSFMLVIANAFIFVFEKFLTRLRPLAGWLGSAAVRRPRRRDLITFTVGVLLVPSLAVQSSLAVLVNLVLPSVGRPEDVMKCFHQPIASKRRTVGGSFPRC